VDREEQKSARKKIELGKVAVPDKGNHYYLSIGHTRNSDLYHLHSSFTPEKQKPMMGLGLDHLEEYDENDQDVLRLKQMIKDSERNNIHVSECPSISSFSAINKKKRGKTARGLRTELNKNGVINCLESKTKANILQYPTNQPIQAQKVQLLNQDIYTGHMSLQEILRQRDSSKDFRISNKKQKLKKGGGYRRKLKRRSTNVKGKPF